MTTKTHTQPERFCYSITEVAKMFDISESTLRYWEDGTGLRPRRSGKKGIRYYHKEHIAIVQRLHYLIYKKGVTFQEARKRLRNPDFEHEVAIKEKLESIRRQLQELRAHIDAVAQAQKE